MSIGEGACPACVGSSVIAPGVFDPPSFVVPLLGLSHPQTSRYI